MRWRNSRGGFRPLCETAEREKMAGAPPSLKAGSSNMSASARARADPHQGLVSHRPTQPEHRDRLHRTAGVDWKQVVAVLYAPSGEAPKPSRQGEAEPRLQVVDADCRDMVIAIRGRRGLTTLRSTRNFRLYFHSKSKRCGLTAINREQRRTTKLCVYLPDVFRGTFALVRAYESTMRWACLRLFTVSFLNRPCSF